MTIKRMSKIVVALMIIATIISAVSMVFATVEIPSGSSEAVGAIESPANRIIGIVQFICYAAAVILLVILGVKFMTASPDGKAEIKKSAVIYIVGAILVFAAGGLLNLIKNTGTTVVNGTAQ